MESTHADCTSAFHCFGTRIILLGVPLLTDRWGIGAFLEDMRAEITPEDREEAFQFYSNPDHVAKPKDPTKLCNRTEEFYPGLLDAAVKAMKELEAHRIRVGRLVFINGRVQAWPAPEYSDRPCSDIYRTGVTPETPGYEAICAARESKPA